MSDNDLKDLYVLNHLANYADDKIIERIRQYCEFKPNFVESFTLANTLNKVTDLFIGNKNVRVDYVPPVKQNYAKIMIVFKTSSSASRACRKLVSSKLVTVEPHSVGVANRGKKLHKYFWVDGNPKEVAK